jgi:hypothetical protein
VTTRQGAEGQEEKKTNSSSPLFWLMKRPGSDYRSNIVGHHWAEPGATGSKKPQFNRS